MSTRQALARIAENRKTFDQLINEAQTAVGKTRYRVAAATLQSAARFAWFNHPGLFFSPELDRVAARIGDHLPIIGSHLGELRGHIVHVLSQAYSAGGHTRLVWRWIENDDKRVNSVVITGQQGVAIPQELQDAVAATGGRIVILGENSSDLLVRAAELKRIVERGVDTVVLHVHPYDVIPSIALSDVSAHVIFLNHADHVFSTGVSISDLVADIRPAGRLLSIARRNVPIERSTILPIPLTAPPARDSRTARRELNISQDSVVILSIASEYKYAASEGDHFIDIHRQLVIDHPNVELIVIGPRPTGRWLEASNESGGRFRAVGMVRDIDTYYASADVYVDSVPFASLTSLLDAAIRGVPVVALSETLSDSVLSSNDISLTDMGVHTSNRSEYIRRMRNLISMPETRRQLGDDIRKRVLDDHSHPGWNRELERILDSRKSDAVVNTIEGDQLSERDVAALDHELVKFQDASGLSGPLWTFRVRDAPFLPTVDRVRLLMTVPWARRLQSLTYVVPDVSRTILKTRLARLATKLKRT